LTDEEGRSIALLSLYSAWPGCFSTTRMSGLLADVQRSLSHAMQRRSDAPVLPLLDRSLYRSLLARGQVRMLYQPIIDLRDGSLRKVEALARLVGQDGELVAPDRFLPAFGTEDLLRLLKVGLDQCSADCSRLESLGIETVFAVNFPAEGVGDPRYEQVVLEALRTGALQPQRLQLEILESRASVISDEQRTAFLQRLQQAGVRVAQDDLGSGHSSLLRLDQYGFDEVKIDQGLVRGALARPQRALEFILYLTRLAHAFGMPIVVEGLESAGMIEAAAILGADLGQGYGIALPMAVEDLACWTRDFRFDIDAQRPRTALGALSAYLLWDLQCGAGQREGMPVDSRLVNISRIEHYLALRGLQDSELAQLLSQQLVSGTGTEFTKARTRVIETLGSLWFSERADPGS
jgi:EAL domain-containing protein (putative c-di-GMP-specific phosphodiesterase class I)